jgi:hypothetical protein
MDLVVSSGWTQAPPHNGVAFGGYERFSGRTAVCAWGTVTVKAIEVDSGGITRECACLPVPEATDIRPESGTLRAAELAVSGPWPPPAGRARCAVAGQHDGDGDGRRDAEWKSSANRPPAASAATATVP